MAEAVEVIARGYAPAAYAVLDAMCDQFRDRPMWTRFSALGNPSYAPAARTVAGALDKALETAAALERAGLLNTGWRERAERAEAKLNTPELHDFAAGVVQEAAHQRERWGSTHDAGKAPADWFWLVGYLSGKALHAQTEGRTDKALHHTISTAAALANWHAAISGSCKSMRPGIAEDRRVHLG